MMPQSLSFPTEYVSAISQGLVLLTYVIDGPPARIPAISLSFSLAPQRLRGQPKKAVGVDEVAQFPSSSSTDISNPSENLHFALFSSRPSLVAFPFPHCE